jgi:hypothetical protein
MIPIEYRTLVGEALAEFDRGHFAESRALFLRAHALKPSARTLRGLGIASFELREYRATIAYMEQALASKERPLDDDLRAKTELLLSRSNAFVGRYTLQIDPPSAQLKVDGNPVSTTTPLLLDIGAHVIAANATDHFPETRTIHVLGGEVQVLPVSLVARSAAAPAPLPAVTLPPVAKGELPTPTPILAPSAQVDEGQPQKRKRKVWWWTAAGMVLAGTAATVAGVMLTRDDGGGTPDPVRTDNTIAIVRPLEVR